MGPAGCAAGGCCTYAGDRVKCGGHDAVVSRRLRMPSKIFCRPIWPLRAASSRCRCRVGRNSMGGDEDAAGFADGLEVAVHLDRSSAVPVAEHAPVHLSAKFAHFAAFVIAGELAGLAVECFDLLGDGEGLVGDGLVGYPTVDWFLSPQVCLSSSASQHRAALHHRGRTAAQRRTRAAGSAARRLDSDPTNSPQLWTFRAERPWVPAEIASIRLNSRETKW
jgi:hypothetical protein